MNILIYVVSILLVLAAMTYSRLQTYRTFANMEASYLYFMKNTERLAMDKLYEDLYDKVTVQPPNQGSDKGDPPKIKPEGTSMLSLHLLLNQKSRNLHPAAAQQLKTLFKQLMITLYSQQRFFKEMEEKHPQFLDEIIDHLQMLSSNLPAAKAAISVGEISRLEFSSNDLHYTLFLMFQGLKNADLATSDAPAFASLFQTQFPTHHSQETVFESGDEADVTIQEGQAPAGYTSLYNFTTTSEKYKLRVFLANPVLLMAIYNDVNTVKQIRDLRSDLYRQVQAGSITLDEASTQFKEAFGNAGNASSYSDVLNFTVTNTNPRKYEKK